MGSTCQDTGTHGGAVSHVVFTRVEAGQKVHHLYHLCATHRATYTPGALPPGGQTFEGTIDVASILTSHT